MMKATTSKRTVTARVARAASEALTSLCANRNARVTARTLDVGDARYAIGRRFRDALKQWNPGEDRILIRVYGGFVPNSYKYAAESDMLTVDVAEDGTVSATATRGYAQSRPHGAGSEVVVRLAKPGQIVGTLIK